jgi:SpoVK/Ycf46/Vps4 family AAA+-type ATPase
VLDAASGLTRYEAEGAFSLSLVRHGRIEPSSIWELKSQTLTKSGLLSLHRGKESFSDLGGLESLKAFCLRAMRPHNGSTCVLKPKGVLLLGVPGTGKSAFCKALGNETGRPTLTLDVGALMGSLVGQTEERTRRALRIVDAMQPAVLFVDEVEKALSGVAGSGQSDSGVAARMFGSLLSWLNDHESNVFVVCTANDVTKLPPEFCRAERFDGLFFLDLPDEQQKQTIWRMYLDRFGIEADQRFPEDQHWTGAEIRACCRLAALLDVPLVQAAQNIVPVAVTAAESVERLRNWASSRCLSADKMGIYTCASPPKGKSRREIPRDPSIN